MPYTEDELRQITPPVDFSINPQQSLLCILFLCIQHNHSAHYFQVYHQATSQSV